MELPFGSTKEDFEKCKRIISELIQKILIGLVMKYLIPEMTCNRGHKKAKWEEILQEVIDQIKKYIEMGKYSEKLKAYEGVGVGFVDGDITIVYEK